MNILLKKFVLPLILLFLLLPACAQATEAPRPTADPLTADSTPKPVDITAGDGTILKGTYYPPSNSGAPAILLYHMLGSGKQAWQKFATAAQADGYAVLAMDLRGHGESQGDRTFDLMDDDVTMAVAWLKNRSEIDPARIGIAGASIGANLALRGGANNPDVKSVVMLSPGLDYQGLTTTNALSQYGQRPVMLVASENDAYAASSARDLNTRALGEHRLQLYPGADHGTTLLQSQAGLTPMMLAWFKTTL